MSDCVHPPDDVVADIHQGDAVWRGHRDKPPQDYKTQWCRRCGAYRTLIEEGHYTEWRSPRFGGGR